MKQIDTAGVLSGTTATPLGSALLVNVDDETLERLMDNEEAKAILDKVEGFRSLNQDIEIILNRSKEIKKLKKEKGDDLMPKEKRELTEKEKKSLRKQVQEKLIKFATCIPVFMYLTDYCEHCLRDVITQLESRLFYKVTSLTQKDFELLVKLNVFNESLMNDVVYKFKRYEDSSSEYVKHTERVGLFSTIMPREEFDRRKKRGV
ncbi:hypothetical protein BKL49_06050 [Rodentibacter myodis]|uniref:Uncharacterized protein n=2 Tax=Rodentibacter myodis TaxID=1907939 RepID=A0A1V3JQL3_9PAST|nr:hypothetical protein BKL49_06050 [Rodentibacter myodis]